MVEKRFVDIASKIRLLIAAISKKTRRDLEARLASEGAGVSFLGFGVLHFLVKGALTIKDLSGHMMLAPATLVPVVDQLEAKKLIERQVDKTDRRRTPIALTAAGKKILQIVGRNRQIDIIASKLQSLGYEKSESLLDILCQLGASIVGPESLDDILKKTDLNRII